MYNPSETAPPKSPIVRTLCLGYGLVAYAFFFGVFLYMIGFLAGVVVPKSVNSGTPSPLMESLLINGGILSLFACQHMIMARPRFKSAWTKIIPVAIERSTFVLVTSAILALLVWQWRPLPDVIWHVEGTGATVLWSLFGLGWGTVLLSTFLIDHFELFGLRQVYLTFRGRPIDQPRFHERLLYRIVRHPLMTGFLMAFWFTPHMTAGHLFFTVMCTAYIVVGVLIEERDLISAHGEAYLDYKRRVPSYIPFLK
ncbi:MAG: protein-S-isoprenylcysteine O-methyltransferase Ste14 [Planctomycetota bacterium]|jgi:protein-S-isoprenylcysteine O-methyltransferase Ste14